MYSLNCSPFLSFVTPILSFQNKITAQNTVKIFIITLCFKVSCDLIKILIAVIGDPLYCVVGLQCYSLGRWEAVIQRENPYKVWILGAVCPSMIHLWSKLILIKSQVKPSYNNKKK